MDEKKTVYNIPGFGEITMKEDNGLYIAIKHNSWNSSTFITSPKNMDDLKEGVIDYLQELKKDYLTKASELDNILEEAKVNGTEKAFKKYQNLQSKSEEVGK